MRYCFGVDIGGTTIKMGVLTEDGTIVKKWEIKTRTENKGEAILPDIAASIQEKLQELSLVKEECAGIGMGIPAPIKEDGIVLDTANLGWGYKEVKRELEELTGMKVATTNDANAAALGEMWLGGGAGYQSIILYTLGTGVGGGVIIDGKVISGSHGGGGEVGHFTVNYEETECCGCGRKGCLEQYASATGIARLARRRLAKDNADTILRNEEEISAKTVFDAVKAGDAVAIEIAEEFGKYLGYAAANMVLVSDPQAIVIGGGVSKAGEILLDYIAKPFRERAYYPNKDTVFALAKLGNDAGICGAARLAFDS